MALTSKPRIQNKTAERIRSYSKIHPIPATLYIALLSFAISAGLKAISLVGFRDFTDVGLNTFLGLAVGELFLVMLQLMATETAIDEAKEDISIQGKELLGDIEAIDTSLEEKASRINQIAIVNRGYHSALQFFAQLYLESGEPAHDAVRRQVSKLFSSFHVDKKLIQFHGESLSRETYEEFWRYLVNQQKLRSKEAPIIVGTAHSAEVRLWGTPEFDQLWELQADFIAAGGSIYRVLLRSTNSSEPTDAYRDVLLRMKDDLTIRAFFLEIRPEQRKVMPHDYMLVSFDDKTFGFSWLTDLDMHGNHSTVYGSKITIGRTTSQEIAKRWHTLLGYLDAKKKRLSQGAAKQRASDIMDETPSETEFAEMRSILRRFDNMWSG